MMKKPVSGISSRKSRLKQGELSPDTPPEELPLGIPAAYWLDLKGYSPQVLAAEIPLPFLILQGGRDYQVTKTDFSGWETAMKGRENATLKFYDNLNHLFMPGQGKSIPGEYFEKGHVDEKIIDDIALWIKKVTR
jgi:fermentation-respiration switch protein FrsA (DUF1100 family)